MEIDDQVLRPAEAAELLGITSKNLRQLALRGRIAAVRTLGGQRRYRISDVEAFRAERADRAASRHPLG